MCRFLLVSSAWFAGATAGWAVSPAELLNALDRSRSDLRPISTPHDLAEYYRHRTRPVYNLSRRSSPPDIAAAERAMRHEFTSIGIEHFTPIPISG